MGTPGGGRYYAWAKVGKEQSPPGAQGPEKEWEEEGLAGARAGPLSRVKGRRIDPEGDAETLYCYLFPRWQARPSILCWEPNKGNHSAECGDERLHTLPTCSSLGPSLSCPVSGNCCAELSPAAWEKLSHAQKSAASSYWRSLP